MNLTTSRGRLVTVFFFIVYNFYRVHILTAHKERKEREGERRREAGRKGGKERRRERGIQARS